MNSNILIVAISFFICFHALADNANRIMWYCPQGSALHSMIITGLNDYQVDASNYESSAKTSITLFDHKNKVAKEFKNLTIHGNALYPLHYHTTHDLDQEWMFGFEHQRGVITAHMRNIKTGTHYQSGQCYTNVLDRNGPLARQLFDSLKSKIELKYLNTPNGSLEYEIKSIPEAAVQCLMPVTRERKLQYYCQIYVK